MKPDQWERPEAERTALAGMLLAIDSSPDAIRDVASRLSPAMLADPIRREILTEILEALAGERPGIAAVAAGLRQRAAADRHGPDGHADAVAAVADLAQEWVGPDPVRAAELAADEIRAAHARRQAADTLADAIEVAKDPQATREDLAGALERIADVRELVAGDRRTTPAAGLLEILDRWARDEAEPVVRTMFGPLDRRLGGGLPIGLTGIAAKPGEGKSALAMQLTLGALLADREARAVWFRGEMTNDLLAGKMLAIWSALRGDELPAATFKDARRRSAHARRVAVDLASVIGDRLQVIDPPLTPELMEQEIVRHRPRLAVVDYLQLCQADDQADRRGEIEHVTRHLARLSTRHDVAVVVVSAIAKATTDASGIGALAKDSNLLDYDVHTFLTLWADGPRDADPREVRLKIEKSRTGIPGEVALYFSGSGQFFMPADNELADDPTFYADFAAFAPEALA